MSATYAGAKAALLAYFTSGWASTTPIRSRNDTTPATWPPMSGSELAPWVYFEILGNGSRIAGQGAPGNSLWHYDRLIAVHCYVPAGSGDAAATALAQQAGELFRAKVLYDTETPGCYVRTFAPSVDEGDRGDSEGNWYRVSMTCEFEYWHRG